MPPVLYKLDENRTVYMMSEVFVPPKDPNNPYRQSMLRYNHKIMYADLVKKLPKLSEAQKRERRRDLKLREKQGVVATKQYLQSESALLDAIADKVYLKALGKRLSHMSTRLES